MLPYLMLGSTYAFAAAIQPGPLLTYLVARTLQNGWRRTLPATFAPLVSDGPIALLVLAVLTRLPTRLEPALRCTGGVFLLYLAANAFRAWRNYQAPRPTVHQPARRSLIEGAIVNLLNPNPYLGWSLVMGPLLLNAWHETPANAVALLAAFYGTMVATVAGVLALFAGAGRLAPRVSRDLVGASVAALTGFAVYQLWSGTKLLLAQ